MKTLFADPDHKPFVATAPPEPSDASLETFEYAHEFYEYWYRRYLNAPKDEVNRKAYIQARAGLRQHPLTGIQTLRWMDAIERIGG